MLVGSRFDLLAVLALLTACTGNAAYVVVDVRTDFVPHVEFDGVIVEVEGHVAADLVLRDQVPFDGFRVAELQLPPGARRLNIALVGENRMVYRRPVDVVLEAGERQAITVTAARSCRGVRCADDEACINGLCTDPACTMENAEACGESLCAADRPCPQFASASCAVASCVQGMCLIDIDRGCDSSTFCHPDRGCIPRPSSTFRLRLDVRGEGSGSVRVEPLGVECRADCEFAVPAGLVLSLRAAPDPGSTAHCAFGCDETAVDADRRALVAFHPSGWRARPFGLRPGGAADGPLETARYRGIGDLQVMPDGSFCFSDLPNHAIRCVRDGELQTIAGRPQAGFADGPVATAMFNQPQGLALLPDGTLLVADRNNNRIRAITTDGRVETRFGDGRLDLAEGTGTASGVPNPSFLERDAFGALWVSLDWLWLARIAPDGALTYEGNFRISSLSVGAPLGAATTHRPCSPIARLTCACATSSMRRASEARSSRSRSPAPRGSSSIERARW